MQNEVIGNRIETRRKELGLTLDDIAKEIGVAKSTVQRYEKGAIEKIKLPVIEAIARVLSVDPAWLCGKADKMFSGESYLGKRIEETRTSAGFTQKELSERSGVSEIVVREIEQGVCQPQVQQLEKIAAALNVSPLFLTVPGLFKDVEAAKTDHQISQKNKEFAHALETILEIICGKREYRHITNGEYAVDLPVYGSGASATAIDDKEFTTISCAVQSLISALVSHLGRNPDDVTAEIFADLQEIQRQAHITDSQEASPNSIPDWETIADEDFKMALEHHRQKIIRASIEANNNGSQPARSALEGPGAPPGAGEG